MNIRYIGIALLACIMAGCSGQDKTDPLEAEVFARLDGKPLTAAFVRDSVLISMKIAECNGKKIDPARFDRSANGMAAQIIPQLISAMMMEKYLDNHEIKATTETDSETLAKYNALTKRQCKNLEELSSAFQGCEKTFVRQFHRESRMLAYEKGLNLATITDAEKTRYYRSFTNSLHRAEKIDALAHQNSEKAYQRLQNGEAWDGVAQEVSEDRLIDEERADYWKEWDDIPANEYIYPEVIKALDGIPAGGYTKPFDSEMGCLIVRVNSIEDGTRRCSRMMFRMAQPVEDVAPENLEAYLRRQKTLAARRACLDEVGETMKFEYPMGENFQVKIWPLNNKEK